MDSIGQLGRFVRMDYPTFGLISLGVFLFLFTRSIYRLYFHPLKEIPGPRLAAITQLYEFYFDVIKGGKYIWEVEKMHHIYGRHPFSMGIQGLLLLRETSVEFHWFACCVPRKDTG